MTKTSLTAMHAIVSTSFARISSAWSTKPGRWFIEQVGVKAPGTETNTTFLPENNSSVEIAPGPESVITPNVPLGILSPA